MHHHSLNTHTLHGVRIGQHITPFVKYCVTVTIFKIEFDVSISKSSEKNTVLNQCKANSTQTMLSNVYRPTVFLSTIENHTHSKSKQPVIGSKKHFEKFAMENTKENTIFAVGCVMCASNFTYKDEHNIVTSCGHLYHRQCLIKWFESIQE